MENFKFYFEKWTLHNFLKKKKQEKKVGFGGIFRRTPKTVERQVIQNNWKLLWFSSLILGFWVCVWSESSVAISALPCVCVLWLSSLTGEWGCGAPRGRRPETEKNHQKEKTSMFFFLNMSQEKRETRQSQAGKNSKKSSVFQRLRFSFSSSEYGIVCIAPLNDALNFFSFLWFFFLMSCFILFRSPGRLFPHQENSYQASKAESGSLSFPLYSICCVPAVSSLRSHSRPASLKEKVSTKIM